MGIIGLGMLSETSRMRVPRPPQNRTIFIYELLFEPRGDEDRAWVQAVVSPMVNLLSPRDAAERKMAEYSLN